MQLVLCKRNRSLGSKLFTTFILQYSLKFHKYVSLVIRDRNEVSHVYYLKDYCSLLLYQEENYCRLCTAVTSLNMKQSIVVYQSSRHHTKQERRKPSLTKQTEMCAKAAEKLGKNCRGYCSIIESSHRGRR